MYPFPEIYLATCTCAKLLQSFPTFCDPIDCRTPGSSVHGIPQTRILAAAAAKSRQSYLTLCDPIDGSPPGSAVPGILQERTLEWFAISFSNAWKWKVKVKLLSLVLTLHDPMDCSLPGSSIHGTFQARVLEWVAIAFSKEYWSGLQFPLPGDFLDPVTELLSLVSAALAGRFFTTSTT